MRTRAVILRRRQAPPSNRVLLCLFGGILGLLTVAFAATFFSRPPVIQTPPVESVVEPETPEYLWDPDRMGKILQRELDKVEAVR